MDERLKVTVDDPVFVLELRDFLRRATCVADRAGARSLVVELPSVADSQAARTRLALIVAGWQALHPNVYASVAVDERRGRDHA